ncbi:DNA polymerase domain-containing protein [Microlunatus sp. Y2014]|uniref:DNA polymerase domain-containing protein n=1 Tax=Microlunatus sp. Y2014 TaxID=3418488 RepID=UPI003B4946EB
MSSTLRGVDLSSLDTELYDGCGVSKGELITYLDVMADRLVAELTDRALSVVRARPGAEPFMQKNLPKHAPPWIASTSVWAETSQRTVRYPLANDARTVLWLGNQRTVEFHPSLIRIDQHLAEELIMDLDPPPTDDVVAGFAQAAATAELVRRALAELGLVGQVKTSGAKGLHIRVPIEPTSFEDAAGATRALAVRTARLDPDLATTEFVRDQRGGRVFVDSTRAGGATLVSAWSPRARLGIPVSYPVSWDDLPGLDPRRFTVRTVPELVGEGDPWRDDRPAPQPLPDVLVAEGREIPEGRVVAMHEGLRRARARRRTSQEPDSST